MFLLSILARPIKVNHVLQYTYTCFFYFLMETKCLFTLTISVVFVHIAFFQGTLHMNLNSKSSQRRRVLLTPQSDVSVNLYH